MITVLVANTKGGCGKSTVATHLASAFANAGLRTALADADRQGSSLGWIKERPDTVGAVQALDWRHGPDKLPKHIDRLVIDSPAAMKMGKIDDLLRIADVIVVPVLPSGFDVAATGQFLRKLENLKPIRKSKTAVAVVRNRVQLGTRAAGQLDSFIVGVGHKGVGRLRNRTIYTEVASQGLSIFDLPGKHYDELREDWAPLLRYIENHDPNFSDLVASE